MGTPLGAKYIPYTYMEPLGRCSRLRSRTSRQTHSLLATLTSTTSASFRLGFRIEGLGFRVWGLAI